VDFRTVLRRKECGLSLYTGPVSVHSSAREPF